MNNLIGTWTYLPYLKKQAAVIILYLVPYLLIIQPSYLQRDK